MSNKNVTLIVDGWSSRCGYCGRDCDPNEKTHRTNLGYSESARAEAGCGIEWEYIYSTYGEPNIRKIMNREDLKLSDEWML